MELLQEALIYEFKDSYFIIQMAEQGTTQNKNNYQQPSEIAALYSKLEISCPLDKLGKDVINALDNFNKISPKYNPWELPELNNQLKTWVGARGYKTLVKEGKLVQISRNNKEIEIIPFDNYNKNEWWGPMIPDAGYNKDKTIILSKDCTVEILGENIVEAFKIATHNPNKGK